MSAYLGLPKMAPYLRLGDASGRVVATFSNRLAAEKFAEQQQARDESARNHSADGVPR